MNIINIIVSVSELIDLVPLVIAYAFLKTTSADCHSLISSSLTSGVSWLIGMLDIEVRGQLSKTDVVLFMVAIFISVSLMLKNNCLDCVHHFLHLTSDTCWDMQLYCIVT